MRNSIEHHKVAGRREHVEAYVAHAIVFLDSFLPQALKIELKDVVEPDAYTEIRERIYSYEQRHTGLHENDLSGTSHLTMMGGILL